MFQFELPIHPDAHPKSGNELHEYVIRVKDDQITMFQSKFRSAVEMAGLLFLCVRLGARAVAIKS